MPPSPLTLLASPTFLLTTAFALLLALTLRLLAILPPRPRRTAPRRIGDPTRLLVVLGSGGHTAEMLSALRQLDTQKYTRRTYVVSSGDAFSARKADEFERGLETRGGGDGKGKGNTGAGAYDIAVVPRARRVHQSLLTAPWSAGRCLWACFGVLRVSGKNGDVVGQEYDYPDLILTNGPATAVIVILAAYILRFFDVGGANSRGKMRTIYMESWARVTTLSLSGKLLLWVLKADRMLVQWEQLKGMGGRAEFLGVLV
ncbi:Alg14-domain-containing protein [Mytilinidion resinicola]|uniref:UDP-N-acetylglucosamine transferase subunit ALG14 n=1 Tax=Mytilinidion resinicola TaxID=574789 RepID=A0A6A6YM89_9PEZI|nr:Alg14-domain-containing protein [Mytilinidion resinicola]KAF2809693.1 Alg14-domain-containing protein [Mytilinidion resinicola]